MVLWITDERGGKPLDQGEKQHLKLGWRVQESNPGHRVGGDHLSTEDKIERSKGYEYDG